MNDPWRSAEFGVFGGGPMSEPQEFDPVYTSILVVPVDINENGRCDQCGAMVLDYSAHTLWHRTLREVLNALTEQRSGPQVPWVYSPTLRKELP